MKVRASYDMIHAPAEITIATIAWGGLCVYSYALNKIMHLSLNYYLALQYWIVKATEHNTLIKYLSEGV